MSIWRKIALGHAVVVSIWFHLLIHENELGPNNYIRLIPVDVMNGITISGMMPVGWLIAPFVFRSRTHPTTFGDYVLLGIAIVINGYVFSLIMKGLFLMLRQLKRALEALTIDK
jgi:hypothetical protein